QDGGDPLVHRPGEQLIGLRRAQGLRLRHCFSISAALAIARAWERTTGAGRAEAAVTSSSASEVARNSRRCRWRSVSGLPLPSSPAKNQSTLFSVARAISQSIDAL